MNIEKVISTAVLVPIGNGDPMSGPNDEGCLMGLPICWWGLPGIGKSARIKTGARAVGLPSEVIFPSHRQPEDFSGVPGYRDGELTLECILGAVRKLLALPPHEDFGQRGLLFVDEVGSARPAVQDALFGAIWDRLIGDTQLPPGIRIMLATNPVSVSGGFELKPALANRMGHIDVRPPTAQEWIDWNAGRSGRDIVPAEWGEAAVRYAWDDVFPRAKGVMAGFLSHFGDKYVHAMPPVGHPDRGRAWPSPRALDMAQRAIATCLAVDQSTDAATVHIDVIPKQEEDEDDADYKKRVEKEKKNSTIKTTAANQMAHTLVEAILGPAVAADWITWLAEADLPTPEEVLEGKWKIDKKRLDKTTAVLESVTSYVTSRKGEEQKVAAAKKYWPVLEQVAKAQFGDLAWVAAQDLSAMKPPLDASHPELATIAAQASLILGRGIARHV